MAAGRIYAICERALGHVALQSGMAQPSAATAEPAELLALYWPVWYTAGWFASLNLAGAV